MNSKRVYYLMLSIVIILLFGGLFGATYGVNTLLQNRAKQLTDVKVQHSALTTQQESLASAKKQVAQYSDLEKIAKTIVPQDKDQAAAVREIVNLATASGIKQLNSVTFPASTLGTGTVKAGSTTITPAAGSKPGLTQLIPAVGLSGVYQLQITITQSSESKVTYNQFYDFLTRLEQNRRTAQVTGVTLQPDPQNPNVVAFTLIINEFIKP